MAQRSQHHRASSVPSSPTAPRFMPSTPARVTTSVSTTTGTKSTPLAASKGMGDGNNHQSPGHSVHHFANNTAATATILQPRVAVVLNVPRLWHPWLFALRLASILPAIWWGTPSILRLALRLLELILDAGPATDGGGGVVAARYHLQSDAFPLTETALASIWCFASGYLSFFFTDCLMSRWLINYTPQATVVRLVTINIVNGYSTSILLSVAGGFKDARLLLPGWIGIATTLTVCYHLVHQKINIRKETSTSVNVFSIASYLSMITLLAHLHGHQPSYPQMPLISSLEGAWRHAYRIWNQTRESFEQHEL